MKLQSAMEYLMTYGWAILIIAVVLGALFELGIFNGSNLGPRAQPGSCHVFRPGGPGTNANLNLAGVCNGELPQYVAQFNGGPAILISPVSENNGFPDGYTMTAWVNYASPVTVCGYALGMEDSSSQPRGGLVLSCNSEPQPYGETINQTGYDVGAPPATKSTLLFGQWYFIAVDWNASAQSISFYLNGQIVGSPATDPILPTTMVMKNTPYYVIGGQDTGGGYNGYEANAQMYNAALSSNDINALYQEGIGGAPIALQNLVGWWPLNGNAQDYSGNNNNGEATNVIFTGQWASGYNPP